MKLQVQFLYVKFRAWTNPKFVWVPYSFCLSFGALLPPSGHRLESTLWVINRQTKVEEDMEAEEALCLVPEVWCNASLACGFLTTHQGFTAQKDAITNQDLITMWSWILLKGSHFQMKRKTFPSLKVEVSSNPTGTCWNS